MNEYTIRKLLPRASQSFISANTKDSAGDTRSAAKLEQPAGNATLEKASTKETTSKRILVRVTSFRRRLIDEDNLCEKYHVDLCRYSGIIPSDSPGTTKIEVSQIKVKKGEREFVRIEIYEPQTT